MIFVKNIDCRTLSFRTIDFQKLNFHLKSLYFQTDNIP